MFDKERKYANQGAFEALKQKVDSMEAERKTLYSIVDKLSDCIEETNRRFSGLVEQVEALENRVVSVELKTDPLDSRHEEIIMAIKDIHEILAHLQGEDFIEDETS